MDHSIRAAELFLEGRSCSQAVVLAFKDVTGLDDHFAAKLSASFGGGIGRMREVCGAANGMFLVAGMLTGSIEGKDQTAKKNNYEVVQRLAAEFKKENGGSYICRELLGLNKDGSKVALGDTTPEARTEEYYKKRPCLKTIQGAAAIVERMLLEGLVEADEDGKEFLRKDVDYTAYILERTKPLETAGQEK